MNWSHNRRTTRPEDRAYSLLGIFGIHMSPIYGEGEREAFERLRGIISERVSSTSRLLARLPVASGASFDSRAEEHNPVCLENTRTDLLREITEWAEDHNAKAVYWLNGMAGTGKSTISRTLANIFSKRGSLGGNFFFKRGESDRGNMTKFFSTLASHLIKQVPEAAIHIQDTIDADPNSIGKAIREQFQKLILDPVSKISGDDYPTRSYVIIIDALDECEGEEDVELLIKLICQSHMLLSSRLRIFLTSRPELPIRLGFKAVDGEYQDLVLHEVAAPIIEHDIAEFVRHELVEIKRRYNASVPEERRLPLLWPGQTNIDTLVAMAVPLFIFAATMCRFIAERRMGNPDTQLEDVLQYRTKSQESQLDATYLPVLHSMISRLPRRKKAEVLDRFHKIIGLVVTLASPLPISALARILDLHENIVSDHLDLLHSVLSVPSSPKEPVRLLHLSFRDFLLDPEKDDNPFWINEQEMHQKLADHCLRIMSESLRADICNVGAPGTPVSSVQLEKINDSLAPEVQYACRFWAYHLQQAGRRIRDGDEVWNFLSTHFLFWLEAISWVGRTSETLQTVKVLQSSMLPNSCERMSNFLDDAFRFIKSFKFAIENNPLQIYLSALIFAPERSIIRSIYKDHIPSWIVLRPSNPDIWSQCLQSLEGHRGAIHSLAFSPDSKIVISGSADKTIRLWAVDTGDLLQALDGHSGWVESVAFSTDGKYVVSGSCELRFWAADTGKILKTFKGHSGENESIALSSNGKSLAPSSRSLPGSVALPYPSWQKHYHRMSWVSLFTFSPDGMSILLVLEICTLQLWTADMGHLLQTFKGHTDLILSVAFSPDSKLVASGSEDNTIRIWDADRGNLLQTLNGHEAKVSSVAFSPNSKLVVSGSHDGTIRLWALDSTDLLRIVDNLSNGITSVAFSPDGRFIASGGHDNVVKLWAANTGDLLQTFQGHNGTTGSVTFSPDGRLIASGSSDKTIRLWTVEIDSQSRTPDGHDGHDGHINSIAFSHDNRLIASGSWDTTVQLRATTSGALLRTFGEDKQPITSITFSPNDGLIASTSFVEEGIRLWDVPTGRPLRTLKGHSRCAGPMTFSPDSRILASVSQNTTWIWATNTGHLQRYGSCGKSHSAVAFSPNGQLLASGSGEGTIRVLAVSSGALLQFMQVDYTVVKSIAFSPDSKFIASGYNDDKIRLWVRDTGELVRTLVGHTRPVGSVAWSPDGKLLASGSLDQTVGLWAAETGGRLQMDYIGTATKVLKFGDENKHFVTDFGAISINAELRNPTVSQAKSFSNKVPYGGPIGYGISPDSSWITIDGKNLLWLPVDCRPYRSAVVASAVFGSTVVIGGGSGRVIVMRFDESLDSSSFTRQL
ncbi:vegetative incompatibility protein HET-E-1 [Nemania sp. FL0916]|nr:vegetative incompatibility protein HET-E-1 [Nemania sp. FL0916]